MLRTYTITIITLWFVSHCPQTYKDIALLLIEGQKPTLILTSWWSICLRDLCIRNRQRTLNCWQLRLYLHTLFSCSLLHGTSKDLTTLQSANCSYQITNLTIENYSCNILALMLSILTYSVHSFSVAEQPYLPCVHSRSHFEGFQLPSQSTECPVHSLTPFISQHIQPLSSEDIHLSLARYFDTC